MVVGQELLNYYEKVDEMDIDEPDTSSNEPERVSFLYAGCLIRPLAKTVFYVQDRNGRGLAIFFDIEDAREYARLKGKPEEEIVQDGEVTEHNDDIPF